MRILAWDPGLANTAAVLLEDGRIAGAWTFKTKGNGHHVRFADAVKRGYEIAGRIADLHLEVGDVDACPVESYRDIPGELREAANRWSTPLTVGILIPSIDAIGPIQWQDPELVMRGQREVMAMWQAGRTGLFPGDEILQRRGTSNEHCRSAAAHGLHYLACRRMGA